MKDVWLGCVTAIIGPERCKVGRLIQSSAGVGLCRACVSVCVCEIVTSLLYSAVDCFYAF